MLASVIRPLIPHASLSRRSTIATPFRGHHVSVGRTAHATVGGRALIPHPFSKCTHGAPSTFGPRLLTFFQMSHQMDLREVFDYCTAKNLSVGPTTQQGTKGRERRKLCVSWCNVCERVYFAAVDALSAGTITQLILDSLFPSHNVLCGAVSIFNRHPTEHMARRIE